MTPGPCVQTILDTMDWTEEDKAKVWEAAKEVASAPPKAGQTECNLTFEQFKHLIAADGGFDLPSRVKDSAAQLAATNPTNAAQPPVGMVWGSDGNLHREPSRAGTSNGTHNSQASIANLPRHVRDSLTTASVFGAQDGPQSAHSSDRGSVDSDGKPAPALLKRRNGSQHVAEAMSDKLRMKATHWSVKKQPTVPTALPRQSTSGDVRSVSGREESATSMARPTSAKPESATTAASPAQVRRTRSPSTAVAFEW